MSTVPCVTRPTWRAGAAALSPVARCFAGAGGCSAANGASSCSCSACSPWRWRRRSGAPASSPMLSSATPTTRPRRRCRVGHAARHRPAPGRRHRHHPGPLGPRRSHRESEDHYRHHPVCAAPCREPARALQLPAAQPGQRQLPGRPGSGRADQPGRGPVRHARRRHLARRRHHLAGDRHRARPEQPGRRVRAGRPGAGQAPQPGDHAARLGRGAAGDQRRQRDAARCSGGDVSFPTGSASKVSPATAVLVVEVLGLVFIGLVSVASFSVMAQRRLRALGMLSAIGATERNLRLVLIVNGLAVGVTGALAGAVLGFAAWFAYVPTLQQAAGHVVDAANLPWWAFALGVVFAIATSVLASRRPAKTMAAVPVVVALSGRPAPPKAVHRTVLPGVIVFAVGVVCLATAGGLAGAGGGRGRCRAAPGGRPGRRDRRHHPARPAGRQHAEGRAPGCRSRSGSRCATWSATGPGPVPRWRRPRSPCSWPWGSASSPASSSRTPGLDRPQPVQQPGDRHARPPQGAPRCDAAQQHPDRRSEQAPQQFRR